MNCTFTLLFLFSTPNLFIPINMIYVNTETIPNKQIVAVVGICRGSTVRTRNVFRDVFAGLKNIVGGEIGSYTELMEDAREQALQRMLVNARQLGAHAIVNVRFTTSQVMQGAAEIMVYGTAVQLAGEGA